MDTNTALSPWDRLSAYRVPVTSNYTMTGAPVLIAKGDPMRDTIVVSLAGLGNITTTISYPVPVAFGVVTVNFGVANAIIGVDPNLNANGGLIINPVNSPYVIDYGRWRALVQQPWYAFGTAFGAIVTVITLSMQDWPESPQVQSIISDTDKGVYRGRYAGRTASARRAKLYGNRWLQRQTISPYDLSNLG